MIIIIFNALSSFSQEVLFPDDFTNKEIKNLNQLNLSLKNYSFDDVNFNRDLKDLSFFNAKRKQNKVWAYVFSTAGTMLLASGLAIDSDKDLHGFKALMYISSAAYYGISIPFFVGNIKNKKQMKKKLIFVEDKLNTLK